jgi:hypothetical protein
MRILRTLLLTSCCGLLVGLCACSGASGQTAAPGPTTADPPTTGTGAPSTVPTTPARAPAHRVLLLGDSTMADASPALEAMFEAAQADVTVWAGVGFGLTGLGISAAPSPFREEWTRLVREDDPDLVLVMLGFWDQAFVEQHGADAYTAVVQEATDILTADGATVVWMSIPPGGARPDWLQDRAFQAVAQRSGGDVRYVDVEPSQRGPDGDHPVSYVAADGTVHHLRKADGWHFCQDGAEQLAAMVNQVTVADGLALAADGWQDGAWRGAAQYQEPACAS